MKIFVFGSNTEGRHGKGAALFARENHGAIYGQGEGLQGSSYAIPTKGKAPAKGKPMPVLPLHQIEWHVIRFLAFAREHPEMTFQVTRIGCGLAGYKDDQVAPFFREAPENCVLPDEWKEILWHEAAA